MMSQTTQADGISMITGYSLATIGAKHVIDHATPRVCQAIEQMELSDATLFTLADMGCADGGTSVDMIRAAVQTIQQANSKKPIAIIYSDQLRNNYNALFQVVYGNTAINSYIHNIENVSIFASATSFYQQIVPTGSLNLGFSATAMHWLSRKPGDISNHVQAVGAQGEELEAFAQQGLKDWETILLARAPELTSGGRLVLVNFCKDEAGHYLGHTGGVNMFDTFNEIWLSFIDDGTITPEEYRRMTLPQYYKTVDEFAAPLTNPDNPVYQAGLRLESIETHTVKCPYAADFTQHGDAAAFANAYIPTIRSWNESIFYNGLSEDRSAEARRDIINRYYDSYEALVRNNPEGHGMDYVHAYMTVVKV
ncbi:MAG: SAM-dependent methyltransferase [Chloroflexota bacterium]